MSTFINILQLKHNLKKLLEMKCTTRISFQFLERTKIEEEKIGETVKKSFELRLIP